MSTATLVALITVGGGAATIGAFVGPLIGRSWRNSQHTRRTRRALYEAVWGRPADPEHDIEAVPGLVSLVREHIDASAPPAHEGEAKNRV